MADPDADSWMLDDDTTDFSAAAAGEDDIGDTQEAEPQKVVEAPKPPAEWRKTYKLAVSNSSTIYDILTKIDFVI